MSNARRAVLAACLVITFARAARGDDLPPEAGPARTVRMFDLFCLSQLPEIDDIVRVAAAGSFSQITGKDLERYQPQVKAEELHAWRYDDLGSEFVLTSSRSKPDDRFKLEMPEFANSTNTACSLLIPAKDPKEAILQELKSVMSRDPDERWNDGPMEVYAWTGQTEAMLVSIQFFHPMKAGPLGVLSASAFAKN